MTLQSLLPQLINGLADASVIFLIASGLSLIFGVTRIVNFAHGSFFMVGIYLAYSLVTAIGGGALGFWAGTLLAAVLVGLLGAAVEWTILRRIYDAPELFQLLATFALVLIIKDATLWVWGADELFAPRAPGLQGSVSIFGALFPEYDIVMIFLGPALLGGLWLLFKRTRWGVLVRAATQDREMVGALGVNQGRLFTTVFALGCLLAGAGGALQGPRMPANLALDMDSIGTAFAVVVVGGMGSIPGAFVAALIICELKALCIALGTVHLFGVALPLFKFTLVAEFVVMAVVLVFRPHGLLGRPAAASLVSGTQEPVLRPASGRSRRMAAVIAVVLLTLPVLERSFPYLMVLGVDVLIAMLFAASLHFIMGPGGMHSFGHAAYFGLGAYVAAVLVKSAGLDMMTALPLGVLGAAIGATIFGWFSVRLSGVYLAMLTLAFGQLVWAVAFQWDAVTGGSNGLIGLRPPQWLRSSTAYYYFSLVLVAGGIWYMRRALFSPFGFAMRAVRDSQVRADAIGIDAKRVQWAAFILAGTFGGLAGTLFAFAKGSISPEAMHVGKSIDGLVMVLLGGVQTITGPLVGASVFIWLQDTVARSTDYWRALLGLIMLALVLVFPAGIVGSLLSMAASLKAWAAHKRRTTGPLTGIEVKA
ncbi:ABC transporter permease [Variovorax boronicumulans]